MTAVALERAPRPLPVPVALGLQEGLRIVAHPVSLVGLLLMTVLVAVVGDNGSRDAFEVVSAGPTFFHGVFTYFAANLVASRDRRAHSGELLAAVPSSSTSRVTGLVMAALVPAALSAGYVGVVHAANLARELYLEVPGVWHLAQGPLTVLGGALLGIMVARLTSIPGAALLVMVAMVAWNVWVSNHTGDIHPLGTYVSWAQWASHPDWAGMQPGSPGWHALYLVALCAMAATGAHLREAARTWRVLAIGSACTLVMLGAGWAQLP